MKFSRFIVSFLISTTLAFSTDTSVSPEKEKKQIQAQQFEVSSATVPDHSFGVVMYKGNAYTLHDKFIKEDSLDWKGPVRPAKSPDPKFFFYDVSRQEVVKTSEDALSFPYGDLNLCDITKVKHSGNHSIFDKEDILGQANHIDPENGMITYKIKNNAKQGPRLRMIIPQKGQKFTSLPKYQSGGEYQGKPVVYKRSPLVNSRNVIVIGDIAAENPKVKAYSLLQVDARAGKVVATKVVIGTYACVLLDDFLVEVHHGLSPSQNTTFTYHHLNDLSMAGRQEYPLFFPNATDFLREMRCVGLGNTVFSYMNRSTSEDLYFVQFGQKEPDILKMGRRVDDNERYCVYEGSKAVLLCTNEKLKKGYAFHIEPKEVDLKSNGQDKGDSKEPVTTSETAGSGGSATPESQTLTSSTSKPENHG